MLTNGTTYQTANGLTGLSALNFLLGEIILAFHNHVLRKIDA